MTHPNHYWTIHPEPSPPHHTQVCDTCTARSQPTTDPGAAELWCLDHSEHTGHTRYCEEVTRHWLTEQRRCCGT